MDALTRDLTPYRVRIEHDPDAQLHDPNGDPLPGTRAVYDANPIQVLIDDDGPDDGPRRDATWEEYCAYWGDPDRHVVVGVVLERRCACCQSWSAVAALGNVDFMDDDDEAGYVGALVTGDAIRDLPGYLREVAAELLDEADSATAEERMADQAARFEAEQITAYMDAIDVNPDAEVVRYDEPEGRGTLVAAWVRIPE